MSHLHCGWRRWLFGGSGLGAFFGPLGGGCSFIGIALTDILPVLPDVLHASILAFLAVLFGYAIVGIGVAFRPVEGGEAARRVEIASGLKHRR